MNDNIPILNQLRVVQQSLFLHSVNYKQTLK